MIGKKSMIIFNLGAEINHLPMEQVIMMYFIEHSLVENVEDNLCDVKNPDHLLTLKQNLLRNRDFAQTAKLKIQYSKSKTRYVYYTCKEIKS